MLIFTDGSFSTKPKMSGLGAVILFNDQEHTIGCYSKDCVDNNVTEIAAIAMALQYVDSKMSKCSDKTITIMSDSEYALRKINQSCEGKDEFEQSCLDFINEFMMKHNSKKINFMHIKGHVHNGDKLSHYNNMADRIAGEYRLIGLELDREYQNKKRKLMKNVILSKKHRKR